MQESSSKWLLTLGFGLITLVSGIVGTTATFLAQQDVIKAQHRQDIEILKVEIEKLREDIEDNSIRLNSIGVRKTSYVPLSYEF